MASRMDLWVLLKGKVNMVVLDSYFLGVSNLKKLL